MSFMDVLGTVGKTVLSVAHTAAPFVAIVNPALGGMLNGITGKIQSSIVNSEQLFKEPQSGVLKQQNTLDALAADLETTNEMLSLTGFRLVDDKGKLKEAIDAFVLAFNKTAEYKKSFKIEKIS